MIRLNLLSPAQKAALRTRVLYALIERLMISLVSFALLSGFLLAFVKFQLADNLKEIQSRQILTAEYVTVNDSVRALDQQLGRVEALQKLAISPSTLIHDIAERTPPGVAVTALSFDVAGGKMDLNGVAVTREALLAYESALRQSPFIAQLDSPISNLFRKTDANFQFAIRLNVEALKNAYGIAP